MEDRKPVVKPKSDFAHNIILEGRKKLSVSGVEEIESFNDEEIEIINDKMKKANCNNFNQFITVISLS